MNVLLHSSIYSRAINWGRIYFKGHAFERTIKIIKLMAKTSEVAIWWPTRRSPILGPQVQQYKTAITITTPAVVTVVPELNIWMPMHSIANWSRGQNNFSHWPFAFGPDFGLLQLQLQLQLLLLLLFCIHFGHCYLRDNCNKH